MSDIDDLRAAMLDGIRLGKDDLVLKYVKKVLSILESTDDKDEEIYRYFTYVYDEIFNDILFDRLKIKNSTKRLLEMLALPVETRNLIKKEKVLKSFFKERDGEFAGHKISKSNN